MRRGCGAPCEIPNARQYVVRRSATYLESDGVEVRTWRWHCLYTKPQYAIAAAVHAYLHAVRATRWSEARGAQRGGGGPSRREGRGCGALEAAEEDVLLAPVAPR